MIRTIAISRFRTIRCLDCGNAQSVKIGTWRTKSVICTVCESSNMWIDNYEKVNSYG